MSIQKLIHKIKSLVFPPPARPRVVRPDGLSWGFAEVWNQSLTVRPERPLVGRDYVWASEIGGPMIDRYLKMIGTPMSNAPNMRSLRKFQAGDIWEWLCALVLKRAGILIEAQTKLSFQYDGLLRTSGKLDFLAGGQPDWAKARAEMSNLGLPEMLQNASLAIINRLESSYGYEPLKEIVLEIKSCSSFMYSKYEKSGQANANHRSQIFHYLKSLNAREGHVIYVCKDDCLLQEFGIFNPSYVEDEYRADLEDITHYYQTRTTPDKEKEILFDYSLFRFEKNWKLEYSNYLTHLYGFKEPMDYREKVDKPIASWNRTFKRCVVGAKMTEKNLIAIGEAKQVFPNFDELVDRAKEAARRNPKLIEEAEAA